MTKKRGPKIPDGLSLEDTLRLQAADLTKREAKLLYRYHRNVQVMRIACEQSIGLLEHQKTPPPELFFYFRRSARRLEKQTTSALEIYVDQYVATRWMREVGLGSAQATAIFTMVDLEKIKGNVSSLFRFAGYDPSVTKLTKQEAGECIRYFREQYKKDYVDLEVLHYVARDLNRGVEQLKRITKVGMYRKDITWGQLYRAIMSCPWCQELKEVLFRVGMAFRRTGGNAQPTSPYRSIYDWRKEYEVMRNERGDLAEQAAYKLKSRNFRKDTTAYKHYIEGRLPPAHLDARARRFTIKVFLVHLHQVLFFERYGRMPPRPYILDVLGKEREIKCPKWPFRSGQ